MSCCYRGEFRLLHIFNLHQDASLRTILAENETTKERIKLEVLWKEFWYTQKYESFQLTMTTNDLEKTADQKDFLENVNYVLRHGMEIDPQIQGGGGSIVSFGGHLLSFQTTRFSSTTTIPYFAYIVFYES